jgi:Rrf2 family iron-sulfur cluster assembly transcriptional regulator
MQITRASEYAIRGILDLCSQPEGSVCLLSDVSERQQIPTSFLSKIFQNLGKAGMVSSSRGTGGGFVLTKSSSEITLLDVLQAVEGQISLNVCVNNGQACENQPKCAVHPVWREAQEYLSQLLGKHTFAELVEANRKLSDQTVAEDKNQA